MKYEIYIDTLFMTNFIMDFISLWTVKLLLKRKRRIRCLAAAAILSTGSSIALFLSLRSYVLYQLCIHVLVHPLAVMLAYGSKRLKKIAAEYGLVYIGVMFQGGVLDFAYVHLGNMRGYWLVVLLTVCLILGGLKLWEQFRVWNRQIYEVILLHRDFRSVLTGFFDTGNLLTDPYVKQPVHIIERQYIEPLISQYDLKVRYIPYHSLGEQNGLLPVVTLDYMYINRETDSLACIERPICGIAKDKLFQNEMCQILLNAQTDINGL